MFAIGRQMAVLALALSFALLSGGLLHATISHEHVHSHGKVAPIWEGLHATLAHQDKKALAVVQDMFVLSILAFIAFAATRVVWQSRVILLDPVLGETLRRGISPHRAFR